MASLRPTMVTVPAVCAWSANGCIAGGLASGALHGQADQKAGLTTSAQSVNRPAPPARDGKLRVICFGAHPDDCELKAGGTAALWAAQGHHVKFVSVTNGDIGHWRDAGGPLARRRAAEAAQADRILGVTSEVLDIHDGELLPTIENRRTITRLIR